MRSLSFFVVSLAALANAALAAGTLPVNTDDARLALQISAGLAPSAAPDVARADVASPWGPEPDGRVSILDALRLLRAANGLDAVPEGGSGLLSLYDQVDLKSDVERTFILPRALLFRARIVDEAGTPVHGTVTLHGSNDHYAYVGDQEVEKGIPVGVKPDRYEAEVSANHTVTDPETGQITYLSVDGLRGETLEINANTSHDFVRPGLPPLGVLEGTIQAEGFQPDHITIRFHYEDGRRIHASAFLKTSSFRLHLPAGNGFVSVSGRQPDDRRIHMSAGSLTPVEIRANETIRRDFILPRFNPFQGRVIDPSGARVRTVSFSTPNADRSSDLHYSCGLTQGDFEYSKFTATMPPGEYEVEVQQDGSDIPWQVRKTYRTRIVLADPPGPVEIRVPDDTPKRVFSGRVVDPSGRPLANASIGFGLQPLGKDQSLWIDGSTATDADSRFRVSLPEGEYHVSVVPDKE